MTWLLEWLAIAAATAVASYLVANLVVVLRDSWRQDGRP
jgi:hypothetical protein